MTPPCTHCPAPAEFAIPLALCRYHWADWFAGGQPNYRRVILRNLWVKDLRRPLAVLADLLLTPLDWFDSWRFRRAEKIRPI